MSAAASNPTSPKGSPSEIQAILKKDAARNRWRIWHAKNREAYNIKRRTSARTKSCLLRKDPSKSDPQTPSTPAPLDPKFTFSHCAMNEDVSFQPKRYQQQLVPSFPSFEFDGCHFPHYFSHPNDDTSLSSKTFPQYRYIQSEELCQFDFTKIFEEKED